MSAALKETGLLSRLNAGERNIKVFLGRDGDTPFLTTLEVALRCLPGMNEGFCLTDICRMQKGAFTLHDGDGYKVWAARPYHDVRHGAWCPPGKVTSIAFYGAVYGHDIRWFSTSGHGGITLPPPLLARIPEAVRAARPEPESAWFDDVDQWGIVACAFPHLFAVGEVTQGWRHLTEGHEYYATQFAACAANESAPEANRRYSAKAAPRCAAMAAAVREWRPQPPTEEALRLITDWIEVTL
jgi:hypothetical protein